MKNPIFAAVTRLEAGCVGTAVRIGEAIRRFPAHPDGPTDASACRFLLLGVGGHVHRLCLMDFGTREAARPHQAVLLDFLRHVMDLRLTDAQLALAEYQARVQETPSLYDEATVIRAILTLVPAWQSGRKELTKEEALAWKLYQGLTQKEAEVQKNG